MKIKPEHYAYIKSAVALNFTAEYVASRRAAIVAQGKAKDVEMRLRWDLTYLAPGLSQWLSDNVYPYANDNHIDTALRSIMRELFDM